MRRTVGLAVVMLVAGLVASGPVIAADPAGEPARTPSTRETPSAPGPAISVQPRPVEPGNGWHVQILPHMEQSDSSADADAQVDSLLGVPVGAPTSTPIH